MIDTIDRGVTDAIDALVEQVSAGIPLQKSLRAAATVCRRRDTAALFEEAADDVDHGASFAETLDTLGPAITFPERAVMLAGWEGGRFEWAARTVVERRRALFASRRKVRSGLILPAIQLFAVCLIGPGVLLFMGEIEMGTALFLAVSPYAIAIGAFILFRVLRYQREMQWSQRDLDSPPPPMTFVDRPLLRLPVIGGLERWRNLSEAVGILSNLLGAGMGLVQSMQITARALPNGVYRKHLTDAAEAVETGETMSEALRQTGALPPEWINALDVATESGREPEVLARLAEQGRERYLETIELVSRWFPRIIYCMVAMMIVYYIYKIVSGIGGAYRSAGGF